MAQSKKSVEIPRFFLWLKLFSRLLLRFTLVSDSRGLRSDFVSIAQVVVFDGLEVFIELIHQRYAGRDVQFEGSRLRPCCRGISPAHAGVTVSGDNDALAAFRRGRMVSFQ